MKYEHFTSKADSVQFLRHHPLASECGLQNLFFLHLPSSFRAEAFGSFIRQRHSLSRLLITKKLFDDLMGAFEIFPRFREFVLLFGRKRRENEIVPPRMRFRRLLANSTAPVPRGYDGFGKYSLPQRNRVITKMSRMRVWTEICRA